MAKMVGLSRNLKLQWLNKVVELASSNLTEQEIKDQLNEYLSFEISSPTNLRKTREILMNIWVYENDISNKLRDEAISIVRDMPEYALVAHWCMMMATYPVFVDMCKLIGRLSEFQDEITLSQIKQKLYDEWGERTTLYHSIDKLISTLKELSVLQCEKPGKYHIVKHEVRNGQVSAFMVYAMMLVDNSGYYSFTDLGNSVYFYPFQYQLEKELLLGDDRFSMNNFGGELSVSVNV
jgi:malate synthase